MPRIPVVEMNTRDRKDLETRLKRIAGQIAGIQRMVAHDRAPMDVVMQMSAARAALGTVTRILLTIHLDERSRSAAETSNPRERRELVDDIVRTLERLRL